MQNFIHNHFVHTDEMVKNILNLIRKCLKFTKNSSIIVKNGTIFITFHGYC